MAIEQRLSRLEEAAAHLPRSGAELMRIAYRLEDEAHTQWLTTLTDQELFVFDEALEAAHLAAGLPVHDLSTLTDDEIERICNGDDGPLASCPILQLPQSKVRL